MLRRVLAVAAIAALCAACGGSSDAQARKDLEAAFQQVQHDSPGDQLIKVEVRCAASKMQLAFNPASGRSANATAFAALKAHGWSAAPRSDGTSPVSKKVKGSTAHVALQEGTLWLTVDDGNRCHQ